MLRPILNVATLLNHLKWSALRALLNEDNNEAVKAGAKRQDNNEDNNEDKNEDNNEDNNEE